MSGYILQGPWTPDFAAITQVRSIAQLETASGAVLCEAT